MREHLIALDRRAFLGGAALLGITSLMAPSVAFGETAAEKQAEADAVRNQLVGLQADLEAATDSYYKAIEEQDAAKAAMDAEQAKIDDANQQIADLQDKLSTRARSMYRSGSSSFLDFVLGATSFTEFTQNWDLLNQMNAKDSEMVDETKTLREQLQAAKDEFARQEQIAADKAAEARAIQEETQAKVEQATQLVNSLDAEAQKLLEEEQAAAAAAAAAKAQAEAEAAAEAERLAQINNNSNVVTPNNPSPSPVYPSNNSSKPVGSYDSVVGYAMSRIGCPYVWAAEGPDAFDCSGLVTWAYRQVGMYVPHQSESQYAAASRIVSVSEARPGDVLWRYGHVGIAVNYGGSHYVHAPTFGAYVRDTDPLSWAGFTAALQF